MTNLRGRLKKLEAQLPNPRAGVEKLAEMAEGARRRLARRLAQIRESLREFPPPRSKMSIAERLATASTPEEFKEVRESLEELAKERRDHWAEGNANPPPGSAS